MSKVTLILSEYAVDVIGRALGELPFKVAASVVNELAPQVQEFKNKQMETEKGKGKVPDTD